LGADLAFLLLSPRQTISSPAPGSGSFSAYALSFFYIYWEKLSLLFNLHYLNAEALRQEQYLFRLKARI
jgi:hypothetical protein